MVDAARFLGAWLRAGEGIGWLARHYAKLSLSNAARLSFSDLCILLFLFLFSLSFVCLCLSLLSLELGRCSSDFFFLSSRPRTGLATTCITGYG